MNIGKKESEELTVSIFSIIDRKLYAAAVAFICVMSSLVFPMTTSAAGIDFNAYDAAYDCNADGIIDDSDVGMILSNLIDSEESSYHVCDLIKAKRISTATAKYSNPAPELKEFLVSEMDVCESNNMIHINLLMSDFHFVVHEDSTAIDFEFLEKGITYYNIEWTKGVNIVYNVPLEPDECLVSRDIADVSLKVFIDGDKYVLDVVDRPCIYHYPVSTFVVSDTSTWFLINSLMSDFDKEVVEDSRLISFKINEHGITNYVIEWDKADVVFNESPKDCVVSYDYLDTTYQVFIKNNTYMLNVVR
jgi:hypothetical protein